MKKITFLFITTFFSTLFSESGSFEVEFGNVKTQRIDNNFIIQSSSENTYLKWDKFNILENEKFSFIQPNSNSCVLNKVLNEPSKIFGTLESNGKIFLLNQNGILFGKDAKINVASFIASTLDIKNPSSYFENKEMLFEDGTGSITNLGKIEAFGSDIYLISKNIDNQGDLIAKNGSVNLASANILMIKPQNENKILILSDAISDCRIINSGKIESIDTNIISHGNPYTAAIKHTGLINAIEVVTQAETQVAGQMANEVANEVDPNKTSKIYLFAKDSKLILEENATINAHDGSIYLLGKEVHLNDNSSIEAKSEKSPSQVFIGGGFQGKEPALPCSDLTFIGPDVKINADSIDSSAGGKVIVWSNGATQFYGNISTKGGPRAGNGGFIEISGKTLTYKGKINTLAKNGKTGTLLLDPSDIQINSSPTSGGNFSGGNPNTFTANASFSHLYKEDLYSALDNANVIINTASSENSNGDISFASTFNYDQKNTSSGSLTLIADHDIYFSATFSYNAIDSINNLSLTAGNDIQIQAPMYLSNGNATFMANNDISVKSSLFFTNFNDLTFQAQNNLDFSVYSNLNFQSNANFNLVAGNDLTISGQFNCNNAASITFNVTNKLTLFNPEYLHTPVIIVYPQ